MREIKFKYYFEDGSTIILDMEEVEQYCVWTGYIARCQWTGLKDSDGIDLFEGDITTEGTIKWFDDIVFDGWGASHSGFYFEEEVKPTNDDDQVELNWHARMCGDSETGIIKVIGNIYQK